MVEKIVATVDVGMMLVVLETGAKMVEATVF